MAPDDVVEDLARPRLVEGGEHRADGVRPDLVAALHQLDEFVDDGARSHHVLVVAAERQAVAAKRDRALQALAQRVEDAVLHAGELRRDLVRDVENLLHPTQCREALGELFLDELRHDRAVRAAGDLCMTPAITRPMSRMFVGDPR